ncbi:hypothetical protein Pres01_55980 [Metapseudomonas resinovorans]|uniref:DUF4124 domain-containing protein n=1 Tax=Metapseudomonas resinovorans TaxID=53412 RepID=UPI000987BB31|nr:DUF4124 domain-containing protein [Pseudomonas resinovorans]GLZ89547.1 hypothetical protein Pres01_55980 [Pseudomonas resinovorans]
MRLIISCLLLAVALPAAAQIYKYTDANGNTVFTNQPPDGTPTEKVELPPTNSVQVQPPSQPANDDPGDEQQAAYNVVELTNLPDEEALRANNGTFSVGVRLDPRLQPGHSLRLRLDGEPYGQPTNVPRLQLQNIDRGEHTLMVDILAGTTVVQSSAPFTFTVQRVNTSSPALRPPPPTPRPNN